MTSLIIMNILLWIAGIAGFIGILGIIPFSVVGIIFLTKYSNENDAIKKSSSKKKGIIFLVIPWTLAAGGLVTLVVLIAIRALIHI